MKKYNKNHKYHIKLGNRMAELEQMGPKNKDILEAFPDMIILLDADGMIIEYGEGVDLKLELTEVSGLNVKDIKPIWVSEFFKSNIRNIFKDREVKQFEFDFEENGIRKYSEISALSCGEKNFLIVFRHVLDKSESTFRKLFEGSSDAIFILSNNKIVDYNSAAIEFLGYGTNVNISGKSLWELSPEFQPEGMLSEEEYFVVSEIVKNNGKHKFEWWLQKFDGSLLPVEIMLNSIMLNGSIVTVTPSNGRFVLASTTEP